VYLLAGSRRRAPPRAADPQPYRYAAPIEIVQPAPFVELAAAGRGLRACGAARPARPARRRRVRRARALRLARSRPAAAPGERQREAMLFPLPPRPSGNATWPSPVEVTVDGDRIRVRRSAAGTLGGRVRANRPAG
jgi:hypothetical protein